MAIVCGIATYGAATPLLAQTAPAAASTAPSDDALETIVVTATRRSESLQSVPGEVTALTSNTLSELNAHDFADFAAYVPGLSYASEGPTSNLIVIRGITTGSQLSSAIGLYLDDIPLGASTSFGLGYESLNVNLFDLSRVEVLNGPQGTLYGATSLGGTVKYVTAPPDLMNFRADAGVEVSSTEHTGVSHAYRGMVNLPFGEGIAALRLDGYGEYDAGYAEDPVYHRNNLGWAKPEGGRASFLLQPLEGLDIRLTALTQRISGEGGDIGLFSPVTHQPTLGNAYYQAFPTAQPGISSLNLFAVNIDYDMSWAKASSITGYQLNHGLSSTDVSYIYQAALGALGGGADPWSLYVNTDTKKTTEELRLASHDDTWLKWLVGAYFDSEKTEEVVDLLDEAHPGGTFFGIPPFNSALPSTYHEYAGYGDLTVSVTKQFDIGLGVRYSRQTQDYGETVAGLLATLSAVSITRPTATSNQSVTTYLINPKYKITDDAMVYARVASGFRPGGPNFVLAPGLGNPTFAPDRLWNYELGEKTTFLDHKLSVDLDVYDIEWKDIQVTVNNGGVNQLENAGNARVDGVELAFNYRIVPALTVGGSAAYTNARLITAAPVLDVTTTGDRLPLSPRANFALIATYDFPITTDYAGAFSVNERYIGDRTTGFDRYSPNAFLPSPNFQLAPYAMTDLNFTVNAPHQVQIGLYVKNMFDKIGQVSATTTANEYNPVAPVAVFLAQPRTLGLTANVKFD